MAQVYILISNKGKYYTGSTVDLAVRIKRHNAGTGSSTTKNAAWRVVYVEEIASLKEARKREKQIKSYKGGNAFKKLVEHIYGDVAEWSKAPHC